MPPLEYYHIWTYNLDSTPSVCNQAIGSVCEKLGRFHSVSPLLVLGSARRVAVAAVPFTIQMQVETHPKVITALIDDLLPYMDIITIYGHGRCKWRPTPR